MNTISKLSLLTILSAAALTACKEEENDIPVSEVPPSVISVVQNALPGIVLDEAEKCTKHDEPSYKLEGKLINGKEYEIKVTESGTILKIELDD